MALGPGCSAFIGPAGDAVRPLFAVVLGLGPPGIPAESQASLSAPPKLQETLTLILCPRSRNTIERSSTWIQPALGLWARPGLHRRARGEARALLRSPSLHKPSPPPAPVALAAPSARFRPSSVSQSRPAPWQPIPPNAAFLLTAPSLPGEPQTCSLEIKSELDRELR